MVKNYILGFLGIIAIVLIVVVVFNHSIPNNNDNKVFENQFIKFNYSSDLNVVDYSNNTTLFVVIYSGDVDPSNWEINAVGTIRVTKDSLKNVDWNANNINEFKNVTISGYEALVVYDQLNSGAIIFLNDSAAIGVLLNSECDPYVNTILNSFEIKKVPPQLTNL